MKTGRTADPGLRSDGGGALRAVGGYLGRTGTYTEPGAWGRIQLTDAIAELAKSSPSTRC